MINYLTAETSFIRAFGNRSLLLVLLCVLSRSGEKIGSASVLGLSLNVSQGIIVVCGPLLAVFLLVALKVENDALYLGREAVRAEMNALPAAARRTGWPVQCLFWVPSLAAAFLVLQFAKEIVPRDATCTYPWWKHFYDVGHLSGTPSLYCIGDLKDGMPWIYPPFEIYGELLCLGACIYLSREIAREWLKAREAPESKTGRPWSPRQNRLIRRTAPTFGATCWRLRSQNS